MTETAQTPEVRAEKASGSAWWLNFGPARIGALYVLILVIVGFSSWRPSVFPRQATASLILDQYSVTGIAALALVLPLAAGVFDLSVGANMALVGVIAAKLMGTTSLPVEVVVLLSLLAGCAIGGINALLVVGIGIDSFIGTLATSAIFGALAVAVSDNTILANGLSGSFGSLGGNAVWIFSWPAIDMLVLMVVIGVFLERTVRGRFFYAAGFNSEATRLVGISVKKVRIAALLFAGVVAAFAGILVTSQVQSADPNNGPSYLIPAFSAAFLGATQIRPGRFNAWGTVLAVVMLGTASVGLLLVGGPTWAPDVFQGGVLLAAVGLARLQNRGNA
jgi:ribose transport system permease protein